MESQPQNPEFRINPENSPMQVSRYVLYTAKILASLMTSKSILSNPEERFHVSYILPFFKSDTYMGESSKFPKS